MENQVLNTDYHYHQLFLNLQPVSGNVYNVRVLVGKKWMWLADSEDDDINFTTNELKAAIFSREEAVGLLTAWQQTEDEEYFTVG